MKAAFLILAVTCAQSADCNGRMEKVYSIHTSDGATVEACGYSYQWVEAACVQIRDRNGEATLQRCGVNRVEFGVTQPAPTPEDPKQ